MAHGITVSSTVRLNNTLLRGLDSMQIQALGEAADAGLTETVTKKIMPFATGNMQNSNTFVDDSQKQQGKVAIVSSTPYARRLYFHPEYNFRKGANPNAGGRWFDWMKDGAFLRKAFAASMRRLGRL